MQKLIDLVRQLRSIAMFKVSARVFIIFLMVLGAWVATRKLEFPPGINVNDKLIHGVIFFGFALLADLASSRKPFWFWKGLPVLFYGIGIEVLQAFTPFRSFSVMDMLADFSGIFFYFLLKLVVLYIVKSRSRHSDIN